jgi:hypothetical protein
VFYPLKGVIHNIENKFRPSLITTESHFALPLTLLFSKIYLNYCSQMGTLASKGLSKPEMKSSFFRIQVTP